ERQSLQMANSQTHNRRSSGVNLGRFLTERCSTPIWCRRARFSNSRAARERKIENRVGRNAARKMSIGRENYQRSIIPILSDTSRFSGGTVERLLSFATLQRLGLYVYDTGEQVL